MHLLSLTTLRELFRLSLPMVVSQGSFAAMAIVFNWDMLSFIPMIGLNIGVMSLIGRFVGAADMARANQVISSGFILALGYSGVLALLFLVFRMQLVQYLVIVVYKQPALVSWWVFVAMLISLAWLYSRRLLGDRWRQPERLARVMIE